MAALAISYEGEGGESLERGDIDIGIIDFWNG
jgi:hypothetical protein